MVALLNTNWSEHSETLNFTIKLLPCHPRIKEISPYPVPALDFIQVLTIHGYDFQPGCLVNLRLEDTGETFRDLPTTFRNYRTITINRNLSSSPARWSVQVVNPGGFASETSVFPVVPLEQIPFWRWWRSGWPWACGGFLSLVVASLGWFWTSRRRLPRALDRVRERTERNERRHLLRNLHDRASADIAHLKFLADLTPDDFASLPDDIKARIEEIHSAARDAETAIDDLVWGAKPQAEQLPELAARVRERVRERLAPHGIEPDFRLWPAPVPDVAISAPTSGQVLYLCHELLNNVVKHSQATQLKTQLDVDDGHLVLMFRDNGRGFDSRSPTIGRRGLSNMHERVKYLGGSFELKTAPGQGTEITFRLPLESNGTE